MFSASVIRSIIFACLTLPFSVAANPAPQHPGAAIYERQCVDCHGTNGEGVPDKYDEPLTGSRSVEALIKRIVRTMPEDHPEQCVGEEAAQVAAYIFDAFYSPAAQARLRPPQVELLRLTAPQYRTMAADLVGHFRGGFQSPPKSDRGLKGRYSGRAVDMPKEEPNDTGEVKKKETVKFDRVDRQVAFSFGAESPHPSTISTEQFSIRWDGSVYAEETGTYEFVIKTQNGARLWVNNPKTTFIDAWVTAGDQVREEKKSLYLLGGRHYPISLEFFKYKDKTASIELLWKTPHGALEVIPERHLSPHQVRQTMVVSTSFPADDRSLGYERGSGISQAWHQAAIDGAISIAEHVEENLAELSGTKPDAPNRIEGLKEFARRFVEIAFRRPLNDEQRQLIETQFSEAKAPEIAVKRVVLFALKSPHYLYPNLVEREQPDSYDVASRLAVTLWDSLPDAKLLEAAAAGQLQTRAQILDQARRMVADARTKAKLHGFFHHWLELERADSIAKDQQMFPGFNDEVLADLRTSLSLFIDRVVWSDRSDFRELLLADYLLLNERLAKFYGHGAAGADFQRVSLDPKERAGVVTHPYLMTAFAHNSFTSPIHRGVFLTRNVLGLTLKSPPVAVAFENGKFDPAFTMREKVTELTRDSSCVGCHSVINPLGFALENFDAIGRWRTEDNQKPVDASGELPMDDGETVRISGPRDVAELAAKSESAHRAFVRHLFHHLVKQETGAFGIDTLERLRRSFIADDFNIQKLLAEIASTAAAQGIPEANSQLAQN